MYKNRWVPLVVILVLTLLSSLTRIERVSTTASNLKGTRDRDRLHRDFDAGKKLLQAKHVPFDPDDLLKPNWRKRLEPVLNNIPEMNVSRAYRR
jgi:hypothetical protein